MTYRVFFCFYGEKLEVASSKPIEMELADVYSKLLGRLSADRDYLGLVDEAGTTLQIMYYADRDCYWTEIPVEADRGSYGASLSFDEVTDLIKALPRCFSPAAFPSFKLEKW